jgi:hypothetical protein
MAASVNGDALATLLDLGFGFRKALSHGYENLYFDKTSKEVFLRGMAAGCLFPARELARVFPWGQYRSFIDIGTSMGCLPVQIALAHHHLVGGGFDLPQLKQSFKTYTTFHGLQSRLKFYSGDFLKDELPTADVLILGVTLRFPNAKAGWCRLASLSFSFAHWVWGTLQSGRSNRYRRGISSLPPRVKARMSLPSIRSRVRKPSCLIS